ncbi:MAG: hypothetical protein KGH93_01915 [Patescibacteria group bacterium]|nr:hypothetical protein [Patescibacteria group bacterium]MDE1945934.1 hypothetical protein [Patescibacteria group bacterium]
MMELLTTSFFVFSSIYGGPTASSAIASSSASVTPAPQVEEASTTPHTNAGLKDEALAYFKNTPILANIAGCESRFRQYDKRGNVLVGAVNKGDIGVMQINTYYQGKKAAELGYDLDTPEGNMAYGKYLYEKEGTKPWDSSSACWKHADDASSTADDIVAMN